MSEREFRQVSIQTGINKRFKKEDSLYWEQYLVTPRDDITPLIIPQSHRIGLTEVLDRQQTDNRPIGRFRVGIRSVLRCDWGITPRMLAVTTQMRGKNIAHLTHFDLIMSAGQSIIEPQPISSIFIGKPACVYITQISEIHSIYKMVRACRSMVRARRVLTSMWWLGEYLFLTIWTFILIWSKRKRPLYWNNT